jgi:predicted enzyme related to lactoylglutathione lyase
MATDATKSQVVWFDVPVMDLDRAVRFYSAVLGCKVAKQEAAPGMFLGVLPHEGQAIGGCLVVARDNSPSDHGVLVYLNCDGRLNEAVDAVALHGGSVLEGVHAIGPYGSRAIVKDSEGNRVALHSREAS